MKASTAAWVITASLAMATGAEAAPPCASLIPYGIAARAQPSGSVVTQVLPTKAGRFVREPLAAATSIPSNEDFNITYRSGRDSVFIGLSRPGSVADLREAVRTAREDVVSDKSINRTGELYCTASAPFFYKIPDFIAWTRGQFFLYAHASSPAVLNEFMRAFPY